MVAPISPGSSGYHFEPSSSIDENINSLIQMLKGSPLSYEKESCQRLFQSIVKTFIYCIAQDLCGTEYVHKYVGHEPSGQKFIEWCIFTPITKYCRRTKYRT